MNDGIQSGTRPLEDAGDQELPRTAGAMGLQLRRAAQLPEEFWPDERISAIRAYVGKEAKTIGQLAAFLATCQRYQLDPMVGQLFLLDSQGGPKVTAGRDTWLSLARREPGYAGSMFGVVHEKDKFGFHRLPDGRIVVEHVVAGVQRGELIGAFCLVRDTKLGDNIEVRELKDFNHLLTKNNWKLYRPDMIQNRCIAAVFRKQYGFPGLLIQGEEDDVLADPTARAMPPATAQTAAPKGGGAQLAALAAAREARTSDAEEVTVEAAPAEAPPAAAAPEPAAAPAPTPAAPAATPVEILEIDTEKERLSRERPGCLMVWKRIMAKGADATALELIRRGDIDKDYPDFRPTYGHDYPAGLALAEREVV